MITVKTLDRQKLDVTNKTRSNLFGWRGQFTPEFEPLEFERFSNWGKFATIRLGKLGHAGILIPSNSTGLTIPANAGFHR